MKGPAPGGPHSPSTACDFYLTAYSLDGLMRVVVLYFLPLSALTPNWRTAISLNTWRDHGFGWGDGVRIPNWPLSSYMTLGKIMNFSACYCSCENKERG